MKVFNHYLTSFQESPNIGGALDPTLIVIHYTAGRGASQSIGWLTNPESRASAHVLISRDGIATQLVPFNRVAWHAGVSEWKGVPKVNNYAIGIELDNPGHISADYKTWFGTNWPKDQTILAKHKNGGKMRPWATFPANQLAALHFVCEALLEAYPGITDVVGHDDVAPTRKTDPGPAFPMEDLRSDLFS